MRVNRRGDISITRLLIFLVILVGGAWASFVGPYWWDYLKMKEATDNAAMTFASYTAEKSKIRMEDEFDRLQIPDYISVDDCEFTAQGTLRTVNCYWEVEAEFPLLGFKKKMSYETLATEQENN